MAGRNGCQLLNDSYNNDLTSLGATLVYADQVQPNLPNTLILSALPEEKLREGELYAQLSQLLRGRIDRLFTVGDQLAGLGEYLGDTLPTTHYPTTEALLAALTDQDLQQELVILKGARRFSFERLASRLAAQVHRTELTIDLGAVAHNLGRFRARVATGTRVAVMVKASAYGSGSVPVARVLQEERADYLFVAFADEGAELRRAGIRLPIAVLSPEPPAFEMLLRYDLEPEIHSWEQLHELIDFLDDRREIGVHLKFDTGMARLGFDPTAAAELGTYLQAHPQLQVCSVFSHLAAAEDEAHDTFTHEQVERFGAAYAELTATLGARPPRHVLNSAGIGRFPQYQYEMVRLGIGLYGTDPEATGLQPVLSLRARIAQVRELAPGATVGYGRRGSLPAGGRIAILSIGYADGLPRTVGRGRFAPLIHGQPAPIVGEVCMDLCMVDVTHIPAARAGDSALFFGPGLPVATLARAADTIPYEILTGIGGRVHRRYLRE
jgi:alanine racemase